MTRIIHPTWRDEQLSGNYPFGDTATLVNDHGRALTADLFLDAQLYVIGATGCVYLSRVEVDASTVTLWFGDAANPYLARASYPAAAPPTSLQIKDLYERPAGVLVADATQLTTLAVWETGQHDFTFEQTNFAATCCLPMDQPGVRGIELADGTLFTGPVWLIGSDGVVLRSETQQAMPECGPDVWLTVIRVDIVGDPLYRRKLCAGLEFTAPQPIRKLRVHNRGQTFELTPDQHGNVFLQTGDDLTSRPALRLREQPDGLLLEVIGTMIATQ
jgi:hypothetical protein